MPTLPLRSGEESCLVLASSYNLHTSLPCVDFDGYKESPENSLWLINLFHLYYDSNNSHGIEDN